MKHFFYGLIIFLYGCSPSSLSEWRVEGVGIVRDLIEELQQIESLEALELKKKSLKKKYNQLVHIMIEADKYEKEEFDFLPSIQYSNALKNQYLRIYEIEGGRELLFEIQNDSLHKFDRYIVDKK